jgi:succinate dehydrogenase/fumarate reductase flavoprotein subunit
VTEIFRENGLNGAVLGVRVTNLATGEELTIRAQRGVVLAAGGFTSNARMANYYDPRISVEISGAGLKEFDKTRDGGKPGREPTDNPGAGATGEVLLAAMDIGADTQLLNLVQTDYNISTRATGGPYASLLTNTVGRYIDVDGHGNRFWQEGGELSTERSARLTCIYELGLRTFKGEHTWWGICDSKCGASASTIQFHLANGMAWGADTLADLAKIIAVPPTNFIETVNRYNELVALGEDMDFGVAKHELTNKLETPPFYAMSKTYRMRHCYGGLRINKKAEVIDRRGKAIPRLYGAGEIAGSVHGIERDGGCGWTDLVVFGRLAGRNAAALTPGFTQAE